LLIDLCWIVDDVVVDIVVVYDQLRVFGSSVDIGDLRGTGYFSGGHTLLVA
jgi:hypothetical protein